MAGNSRSADNGRALVLVGMTGAGKTSVGRELARLLGRPWTDLDRELERRHGMSVARQFARHGEQAFRRRESALLRSLCRSPGRVLSTGGGVVLDPANRALLRRHTVVYLKASPAVLARRLRGAQARARPLLSGGDPAAVLRRMARQRAPLYRSCAGITVLAGVGESAAVARRILQRLAALRRPRAK